MTKKEKAAMGIVSIRFDHAKDQIDLGKECWEFICANGFQGKFWEWQSEKRNGESGIDC